MWTLMVHGGAGRFERGRLSAEAEAAMRAGLHAALDAGGTVLAAGGAALDAVEAAVRVLEDDPAFNAGRGAALTRDGGVELDASIMAGVDRAAGAVAGVSRARSPVALARAVMEGSPHVFLAGANADAFGAEQGLEAADPAWFATPERRRQLAELLARAHADPGADAFDVDMKYGTVGAVARDAAGHLAAATSTGGVTGKRPGRIGDTPVIGAGTWADDRAGAVSCTGAGEFFLRTHAASAIAARMRLLGEPPAAAAAAVLAEIGELGGTGGAIVVAPGGPDQHGAAWHFTTAGMNRGLATGAGERRVAVFGDD